MKTTQVTNQNNNQNIYKTLKHLFISVKFFLNILLIEICFQSFIQTINRATMLQAPTQSIEGRWEPRTHARPYLAGPHHRPHHPKVARGP